MLFNSIDFALFFPLVVALYFATPQRFRWMLLLAASYYFYASWRADYLLLLVVSTVIDYLVALQLGRTKDKRARRALLGVTLTANLGLLFTFKYFNFFNESARLLFGRFDLFYGVPALDVLLPVGISFYTFQTLSYTIDVYRRRIEPERNLGIFALYVSFFPQLVAGPIERAGRLLPQFFEYHGFNYARVVSGIQLMLWGFFQKVVIADRLAIYVDHVYDNPSRFEPAPLLLATYFFAIQIYCDFSGYSDIAIGSARVMGFDLMTNFRRPYFSKSIQEFWSRWHISLSTWFRDYVYIPLGGNRVPLWRWYVNLFIVFLVSGLWHGAGWTYVIWGSLHGAFLIFSLTTQRLRDAVWSRVGSAVEAGASVRRAALAPRLGPALRLSAAEPSADGVLFSAPLPPETPARAGSPGFHGFPGLPAGGSRVASTLSGWLTAAGVGRFRRVLATAITFHLVLVSWVFFRANSLPDAITVFRGLAAFRPTSLGINVALGRVELLIAFAGIGVLLGVNLLERRGALSEILAEQPRWLRWSVYYALLFAILLLGKVGAQQFIYFQF